MASASAKRTRLICWSEAATGAVGQLAEPRSMPVRPICLRGKICALQRCAGTRFKQT